MTCIVGIIKKESNKVVIGADSAGVSGLDLTVRADEKVFINGPFIMGFTTSFRMGQLLRYTFVPPKQPDGMDDNKYMVTVFIDEVRKCLKEGGWATKESEQESGGTFLVGYKGKLYRIDSDYQVGISIDDYDAVGCGCKLAIGSLYTSGKMPLLTVEQRVQLALEAAEHGSAGVSSPFKIMEA